MDLTEITAISESNALNGLLIGFGPALLSFTYRHIIAAEQPESGLDVVLADNPEGLSKAISRAKNSVTWFYYILFFAIYSTANMILPEQKMTGLVLIMVSMLFTLAESFNVIHIYDYVNFAVPTVTEPVGTKADSPQGTQITLTTKPELGINIIEPFYWIFSVITIVLAILPTPVKLFYDPGFDKPWYQMAMKIFSWSSATMIFVHLLFSVISASKTWVEVLGVAHKLGSSELPPRHEEQSHEATPSKKIILANGKRDVAHYQDALEYSTGAWSFIWIFVAISCLVSGSLKSEETKLFWGSILIGAFGVILKIGSFVLGSQKTEHIE